MAENSKIQWTTHTFNCWRGCTKIAAGCTNCYAARDAKRFPKFRGIWGEDGTRVLASEASWKEPVKWNTNAMRMFGGWKLGLERMATDTASVAAAGFAVPQRPRVFVASLADVFEDWRGQMMDHNEWPLWKRFESMSPALTEQFNDVSTKTTKVKPYSLGPYLQIHALVRLFDLIEKTTYLDYLLLSKRIENARRLIGQVQWYGGNWTTREHLDDGWPRNPIDEPYKNVWLGTSIAEQQDADKNIKALYECRDLCARTFLSVEPLIEPVDLAKWFRQGYKPDWVIVGGESGPGARPCDIWWVRSIVRQCRDNDVLVFVKQLGALINDDRTTDVATHYEDEQCWPEGTATDYHRVLLKDSKGGDINEWPPDVRIRQVPSSPIEATV